MGEDLRDVRLVAFLLDVDSGRYADNRIDNPVRISPVGIAGGRLQLISGLSLNRVQHAVARLMEAGVIERVPEDGGGWLQFSPGVIQAVGINQYVDWAEVLGILVGRGPAISVLRAVLELMSAPWEWSRLTYELLAVRACYSVGMAQRGILQLMQLRVLERIAHTGRGHDYRLSAWALGRARAPRVEDTVASQQIVDAGTGASPATPVAGSTATSTMAVELGGLVVRVPVGAQHVAAAGSGEKDLAQFGHRQQMSAQPRTHHD